MKWTNKLETKAMLMNGTVVIIVAIYSRSVVAVGFADRQEHYEFDKSTGVCTYFNREWNTVPEHNIDLNLFVEEVV